jgi:hypothetical protein
MGLDGTESGISLRIICDPVHKISMARRSRRIGALTQEQSRKTGTDCGNDSQESSTQWRV